MSKIDKNTLKVMNIIRGKIGLKDVCKLETDEERQVVWDAIDKQIPKRAIDYVCPICGHDMGFDEKHYCSNCGQRIGDNE